MLINCLIIVQAYARGIFLPSSYSLHLQGYSNIDRAGCPDTRRSVTGMCFFLGASLISWKTEKRTTISRSSSEDEYGALGAKTCELHQWLPYLLKDDLRTTSSKTHVLYCDSQSAYTLLLHTHTGIF